MDDQIRVFFQSAAFGVVGASSNRNKFGNRVLRCYMQHHYTVYPVNPNETLIEGLECVKSVSELPADVLSISIITPPLVTIKIVEDAIRKGIKSIWMQPGAEHHQAIELASQHDINVIACGPCILVELGFIG